MYDVSILRVTEHYLPPGSAQVPHHTPKSPVIHPGVILFLPAFPYYMVE